MHIDIVSWENGQSCDQGFLGWLMRGCIRLHGLFTKTWLFPQSRYVNRVSGRARCTNGRVNRTRAYSAPLLIDFHEITNPPSPKMPARIPSFRMASPVG
ncbi:hypothetical protein RSOLAG22IIIB_06348 [Rhizoctonia solani]|uniref:Uncharacterized protein n=1 Tax=Rhizoctonia solani TaxID=456999 RepID=A0A0K6GDK6_9AGAM|nr:hypothetical protein RSOLAG22IIIB_06348 [Rhizoctonia solani]